jgi:hypothetical protein
MDVAQHKRRMSFMRAIRDFFYSFSSLAAMTHLLAYGKHAKDWMFLTCLSTSERSGITFSLAHSIITPL